MVKDASGNEVNAGDMVTVDVKVDSINPEAGIEIMGTVVGRESCYCPTIGLSAGTVRIKSFADEERSEEPSLENLLHAVSMMRRVVAESWEENLMSEAKRANVDSMLDMLREELEKPDALKSTGVESITGVHPAVPQSEIPAPEESPTA